MSRETKRNRERRNPPQSIAGNSVVVAIPDQVSCDLGGEEVILSLKNGIYYGLDPVGTRIWALLQQPRTVTEVLDALLERYDVEPARCERDLLALLEEMAAEGLIEVRDEAPA
jgi:antitoxin component of MazEF toxin-antitoxin module